MSSRPGSQGCPQHRSAAPARQADGERVPSCCVAGTAVAALPSGIDLVSIQSASAGAAIVPRAAMPAAALDPPRLQRIEPAKGPPPTRFAGLRSHLAFRTILV